MTPVFGTAAFFCRLRSSSLRRFCLNHQRRARSSGSSIGIAHEVTSLHPYGCSNNVVGSTRVWNETENWCSLCLEPLNSWSEHRGKRDHICLEMFYNAITQYGRRWSPSTLWWEVEECTLLRRHASPRLVLDGGEGFFSGCILDYVRDSTGKRGGLSLLMDYYDRMEHYKRRLELYACIQHLIDNGIVRTDRGSLGGGASFHGSLVTFKELFPNLVNMFPFADAKEISALTQMIASTYNGETVFDLCNFQGLLPAGQGGGDTTGGKGNTSGCGNSQQRLAFNAEQKGSEDSSVTASAEGVYSYHWKGMFCRGVMGQLRWALECDSVACPLKRADGSKHVCDPYWQVLSEYTCRALLAEMVFCRVSEYIVRVEGVWRKCGQELANKHVSHGSQKEEEERAHPPRTSNWGYIRYMGDHLYDDMFGGNLPNEGAPKRLSLMR
ncbi:KREPB6 [Trypanosoma equiperdum]|uniref:Uncharacterized protein n=2 Tax=Trypanozoon TaxID=39700 RepID=Q57WD5_TRYB2|nr:hypothetical protein, conserved [Trypanosoma brucei brucei TREU927]AAX70098.1 hypothetical protein, conserved [Trypanosoma brucei]AAZ10432.1 hypothetical protein, conserved [Trypanosoma brucei brucei TREU927]SCU69721.1 KREPB6 [Trypanosoma equiperdum]